MTDTVGYKCERRSPVAWARTFGSTKGQEPEDELGRWMVVGVCGTPLVMIVKSKLFVVASGRK